MNVAPWKSPRSLNYPSLATSLVAKTLRHTLANLGSRIDCWALGERAGKLAKAVCQAGALDPAPNADVALILLDRACDLVQVLRRGKAAGDILSATLPHWAANSTDLKVRF